MPTRRALLTHWLPALLWMTLIFIGSSDVLAAQHTSRFLLPFFRWLLGANFSLEKFTLLHHIVRKGGHLTEYAILAGLLWRALGSLSTLFLRTDRARALGTLGIAALYAASDEFHQSFIPARTASTFDVLIDTVGAALCLSAILLLRRFRPSRWRPGRS